jgi:hypothetical protein
MTAKIGSIFKIGPVNPISGAKSLVRAAKHKLNSGGKRNITNVRSENPSQADGPTQAKQGDYAAAKDCLGHLKDSKGENANFYLQAFEKADELTDLCFKANSGKGYNAFEEIIVKDLKTCLRNYGARDVKNIAKQAETAKGFAFIGNVDNLTVVSRQRFMKKVVEACSARQKELKNPKKAPSSRSNDSIAAPKESRPLAFRDSPVAKPAPSPAEAQPTPAPEKPSQTEAVTEARQGPNLKRRSQLIDNTFGAALSGDAMDYIDALARFLGHAENTGDDGAVAALTRAVSEQSPKDQHALQQAFAKLYRAMQETSIKSPQTDPAYYRLAASLATARPASEVTTERNSHLNAAVKLIVQINKSDFRGFVKSLDEIGELAPEEQAMRLKAIKFAFAKQPPQPENLKVIEDKLHQVLTNKTNVNTHPERVAKLWTTWLALQSAMPRQASPGPVQGRVVKDPVERSLLLLADLLVNNELYGKTPGDREKQLEFIWKLIDVDLHKSLSRKAGSAADKALRAAAAAAVQGYGPEELDKLAEHLAALYQKSPTVGDPPQSQIDHRARVLKTFYNECKNRKDHLLDEINILRRDPPKGAVQASTERAQQIGTNFVTAINDLNIPAFLTALHAIGQINDSAERAAVYKVNRRSSTKTSKSSTSGD